MANSERRFKYFLLGALYFTQLLPMAFFFSGLSMVLREGGYSLQQIGYLGFMGLPYATKFLWAPYIDRGAGNPNHYKRIVLWMTIGYSVMAAIASQINPVDNLFVLIAILTIALTFLATQDIAVDAIATRILKPEEVGMGNGLQAAGAFSGYLAAGVMWMNYDRIGWSNSVLVLTGLLVFALIPLLFFHEPAGPVKSRAAFRDIFSFFKQKGVLAGVAIAVIAGAPLEVAYHKMRPLLTDAGYSVGSISLNISIIGMLSGLVMSIGFGYIMKRVGIRKGFLLSVLFVMLAFPALILVAYYFQETKGWAQMGLSSVLIFFSRPLVLVSVLLGGAASGAIHATVYALYMSNGREGKEGTDFTVQGALSFFITKLITPFLGAFADDKGYYQLFCLTLLMHLVIMVAALFLIRRRKPTATVIHEMETEIGELAESERLTI